MTPLYGAGRCGDGVRNAAQVTSIAGIFLWKYFTLLWNSEQRYNLRFNDSFNFSIATRALNRMLDEAMQAGDIARVELLMNWGIHPTVHSSIGSCEILYSPLVNNNLDMIRFLLANGVNFNVPIVTGHPFLYPLDCVNTLEMAVLLLMNGDPVCEYSRQDILDVSGHNPLHIPVWVKNNWPLAILLLSRIYKDKCFKNVYYKMIKETLSLKEDRKDYFF